MQPPFKPNVKSAVDWGLHVRGPGGQRRREIEDLAEGPEPVYLH
jgi:hypothetical protein